MKCLIYLTLFYILGLAIAVDFARPQREPAARFNGRFLKKWKDPWFEPRQSDEPVPGLVPDDSSDDEDYPEEPGTPRYD